MLQAGVASVVSSFWAVEELSTALLMRRLYEELAGKIDGQPKTVAVALHKAQLWLRDLTLAEANRVLLDLVDDPAIGTEAQNALLGSLVSLGRRGERPFQHPYYWAGMQAMGRVFESWAEL